MLKKENRLLRTRDFSIVFKKGRSAHSQFFLCKCLKQSEKTNRYGFVVSTKVSKKAVVRNTIKRKMREAVRTMPAFFNKGYDCVFIVKSGIENIHYGALQESIIRALEKATQY